MKHIYLKLLVTIVFLCVPCSIFAQNFTLDKNDITLTLDGSSQVVTATLSPPPQAVLIGVMPPAIGPKVPFTSGISWSIVPDIHVTTTISNDRFEAYTTFTATSAVPAGTVIVGTYQGYTQTVRVTTQPPVVPLAAPILTFAPDTASNGLRLSRNGNASLLRLSLTKNEDYPDGVLDIGRNEIMSIDLPSGTMLKSSDPTLISIVANKFIVPLKSRGEAKISVVYDVPSLPVPAVVGAAEIKEIKDVRGVVISAGVPAVIAVPAIPSIAKGSILRLSSTTDGSLSIRIGNDAANIIATPSYRAYKEVRDAYGSRIADNFLVVQVTISNFTPDKQFLLKDVSVSFDPNQCDVQEKNWKDFKKTECLEAYQRFFKFPVKLNGSDNDIMLAIAEAEKYRSKRYIAFQVARFVADVGGGLTTFKLLGRDGISAFSFLGGTLFNTADSLIPKIYLEKKKKLETDLAKENSIVGDKPLIMNIFIPATFVLSKDLFKVYKKGVAKLNGVSLNPTSNIYEPGEVHHTPFKFEESDLHHYMLMFLVANAKGILIDRNAVPVNATQGGGAPTRQ